MLINDKPWYREPWPWLLMTFPIAAIVAGIVTLILALRSEDGLVAADYYKEGLAINRQLERKHKAADLGLHADGTMDSSKQLMRVHLESKGPLPAALSLRLVHPTKSGMDQNITLKATLGGWYEGPLRHLQPAQWQIVLEDLGHTWRLDGHLNMLGKADIQFIVS